MKSTVAAHLIHDRPDRFSMPMPRPSDPGKVEKVNYNYMPQKACKI